MGETEKGKREMESDEAVLARSLREPSLFEILVKRYEEPFLRRANRILHDSLEAEDVVQETFTKIYVHAPRFKKIEGARFRSWAYTILENTALSHYRRRRRDWQREIALPQEILDTVVGTAESDIDGYELVDRVRVVLARVPRNCERILRKYFFEGKSHKEIAREEGVSVGAVKTRMYRAKEEFRKIDMTLI